MYYHPALLELEAKTRTRDLLASASAPAAPGLLGRVFRSRTATERAPVAGRPTAAPVA